MARRGLGERARVVRRGACGVALALALAMGAGGCWSYRPGDRGAGDRGAGERGTGARLALGLAPVSGVDGGMDRLPAEAWPARSVEPLQAVLAKTPKEIVEYEVAEGVDPATLPDRIQEMLGPRWVVDHAGVHGLALLRIYRPAGENSIAQIVLALRMYMEGFRPNATLLTSRTLEGLARREAEQAARAARKKEEQGHQATSSPVWPTGQWDAAVMGSGISASVPGPREGAGGAGYVGVMYHFRALGPNPFEPRVLEEFRERGWAVVTIGTQTWVEAPVPEADRAEIERLQDQVDALMDQIAERDNADPSRRPLPWREDPLAQQITRLVMKARVLQLGAFEACKAEEADAAGVRIAAEVDTAIAGNAYAAEAIELYFQEHRPDLKGLPRVVVGFSAGALAAPAAAVRLAERIGFGSEGGVAALVLIGGGGDLFTLSQKSELFNGGITLRCGKDGRPPEPVMEAIHESYLRSTRLDPIALAPMLRGVPVLQVHARHDRWVPAAGGMKLYEALGRPDMLRIDGGHGFLFYFLPGRAGFIADWLEEAARTGSGPR